MIHGSDESDFFTVAAGSEAHNTRQNGMGPVPRRRSYQNPRQACGMGIHSLPTWISRKPLHLRSPFWLAFIVQKARKLRQVESESNRSIAPWRQLRESLWFLMREQDVNLVGGLQ